MVAPIVAIVLLGINPVGNILNIEFLKKTKYRFHDNFTIGWFNWVIGYGES